MLKNETPTARHQQGSVHNTYLYLQPVEHLYLYTFHLCVASYLLTPGCVSHLCGQICLLCIFTIIIFIFLLLTLWKKSSRELMIEADKEKEITKFFQDFLWFVLLLFTALGRDIHGAFPLYSSGTTQLHSPFCPFSIREST